MRVDVSPAHNVARLAGTLSHLSTGPGRASIEIYGTEEVGAGADAGGAPLVVIVLDNPPATLVAGALVLHQFEPTGDMILVSGIATWARFKNGAGAWNMDTDVSLAGQDGAVQLPQLALYAGGLCVLSPSVIG